MKNIKSSQPNLIQLKYILLLCVFYIVTFRSSLHYLIYDIAINTRYFKISIAIVFLLLVTALMVNRINIKSYDYIFLFLGGIFILYNMIVFEFRGVVNSTFYFLGVYLFYPHLKFYKILKFLFILTYHRKS